MGDLAKAIALLGDLESKIDYAIHALVEAELDNPFERQARERDRVIMEITDLIEGVKIQIEALTN
jgi:hypothetical protein